MPVVRVEVSVESAELAADALWGAGCTAVAEAPLADGRVQLTADVADPSSIDPRWSARIVEVDEDADLDAWRAYARPELAGAGFVLVPDWLVDPVLPAGRRDVWLDSGRTFGSGSHPTTRRCVAALETLVVPGIRVADLGCGSGVLGVVAALLGATEVTAVDVDPQAVAVTFENARLNAVEGKVAASTTAIDALTGPFDLVVANIGIRVLTDLADVLAALVAPAGHLVLSGLLADQADACLGSYPTLRLVDRFDDDGWATLTLGAATALT